MYPIAATLTAKVAPVTTVVPALGARVAAVAMRQVTPVALVALKARVVARTAAPTVAAVGEVVVATRLFPPRYHRSTPANLPTFLHVVLQ